MMMAVPRHIAILELKIWLFVHFSGIPFYKPGSICTKCEEDNSFCENGLCGKCLIFKL